MLRQLVAAAVVTSACAASASAREYTLTVIPGLNGVGSFTPRGINDVGQVTGNVGGVPVLWTPGSANATTGTTTQINGLATAGAINNKGQVLGAGQLWTPDTNNGSTGTVSAVPSFPGASSGTLTTTGLNNLGQVTGYATAGDGFFQAGLWSPTSANGTSGTTVALPRVPNYGIFVHRSFGVAVNDAGLVAGNAWEQQPGTGDPLTVWKPSSTNGSTGSLTQIGAKTNGQPMAINSHGVIAGRSSNRGWVWTPDTPNGTTGSFVEIPGYFSQASDINDAGGVVGYVQPTMSGDSDLYVWTAAEGRMDLSGLIDNPLAGLEMIAAHGINNAGQILIRGEVNGNGEALAILLTPVPEPVGFSLSIACGCAVLLRRSRRAGTQASGS